MSDEFSYLLYNVSSGARIAEVPFTSFTWTDVLNRPGSFSAMLPWYHRHAALTYLEPGRTAVYVDQGGQIRFGGIIWTVEVDVSQGEGVRIAGEGFWSYWRHRWIRSTQGMTYQDVASVGPTDVSFTAVDQLRIVADLIAHGASIAGAANVGFTSVRNNGVAGGALSGQVRTKKWQINERKRIAAAVEELALQQFGFDFSVGFDYDTSGTQWAPRRYLDLWYPRRGQSASGAVLNHGANVTLLRLVRDASMIANPVVGIGPGIGDAAIISEQEDASFRYPAGQYPYMEDTIEYREDGQEGAGNLTRLVAGRLFRTRGPVTTAKVDLVQTRDDDGPTFSYGDISLGDTTRLVAPVGQFDVDQFMRAVAQTVTVAGVSLKSWQMDLADDDASLGGI